MRIISKYNAAFAIGFIVSIISFSACTDYRFSDSTKILIKNNTRYCRNDSIKLLCELLLTPSMVPDTVVPKTLYSIQLYVLKKAGIDRKKDLIVYSDREELIVLRKNPLIINNYRGYSVFDTTIYKNLPDNTLKRFYRKSRLFRKTKTGIIEDVIQTRSGYLSFIYFWKNDSPDFMDMTDPDDVFYYYGFYKETFNLAKRNSEHIIYQQINNKK